MNVVILHRFETASAAPRVNGRGQRSPRFFLLMGSPSPQRIPLIRRMLRRVASWCERMRQRQELATLDWRTLRDIGVTPEEALREANKPFWR